MRIKALAASEAGAPLQPFEYELGELGEEEVDIKVHYCGICHSDLSMWKNDWQMTAFPFVPGHEVIGEVAAVGDRAKNLQVGQTVGLGWISKSCMRCESCMDGDHNLCLDAEGTIVGRHGGFAERTRAHSSWVLPLPSRVTPAKAGPLFCGGITVFNPIIQNNIRGGDRIGVVGIGGLGHMALRFLQVWGCEVTAFSTSPEKEPEARKLGAQHFVNTRDEDALEKLAGSFDMIVVTVNVPLPWDNYINALKPKGVLHLVGAAPEVTASVFGLIVGQKSISASPVGSPANTRRMLEFCSLHGIEPLTESFPMSEANSAFERLESGKPRYRIVLKNDL